MAWYRLRVTWTYSTSSSASSATSALQTALTNAGRSETPTRVGNTLDLIVEPLTMSEATSLRNSMLTGWNTGTRTAGKASVVRRDESSG